MQPEPRPIDTEDTTEPAMLDAGLRRSRIVAGRLHGDRKPLYCRTCGEVIGVYEPLVTGEDLSRVTSRAAEPELLPADGDYFHRSCLAELQLQP